MDNAWLQGSPSWVPRSCIPPCFVHRNASWVCEPSKSAAPTIMPALLMDSDDPLSPPSVPRSCIPWDLVQTKGWDVASPAKVEKPVISPPSLRGTTSAPNDSVPPKPPTSNMRFPFQTNGCVVGNPVLGLIIELVKDIPATCPL